LADRRAWSSATVLAVLAAMAALSIVLFMLAGARGPWSFILPFRGTKVVGMILVGHAIAMSTVLFQTVTQNRILTPAIMGLDNLYLLIQTLLVVMFGTAAVTALPLEARFAAEAVAMIAFSTLLFVWLFADGTRSIHLLVLVGIVFGVFFRSITNFLQRLLDPEAFTVLQDSFFASFNSFDVRLLGVSTVIVLAATIMVWRMLPLCDVLILGRPAAIGLGVDHRRAVLKLLMLIAVLVAVSTALVGPVTFFGLLVANLAYFLIPSHRHALLVPAASLVAVISLVGGQFLLERVFALDTALSIIIEFAGGIVFILLLMRGQRR
jgi:iron complex transport system permease protein